MSGHRHRHAFIQFLLFLPMRGYEPCIRQDDGDYEQLFLPMRGYEPTASMETTGDFEVISPHEGL